MISARFQSTQARIGGAPKIISTFGSDANDVPRIFFGTGAPSASTLPTGNGKYNAINKGYVASAGIAAAGSGYVDGDVLTVTGGTGTALQVTRDGGDWIVSRLGTYSVYPANPAATTGGSGAGATLNLNFPPADMYYDITTPSAPVLYVCTTNGDKTSSVWAKVSGGAALSLFRFKSYHANYLTCRTWDGTTEGGTDIIISVPFKLLEIAGETIDGDAYDYAYSNDANGNRIKTVNLTGSATFFEEQIIAPRLIVNDLILAMPIMTGYTSQTGPTPTFIDLNVDGRAWSGVTGTITTFPNL